MIVFCKSQRSEIRKTAYVMDIPADIEFHFQRTVPVLKREHGAPIEPEVGAQDFLVKDFIDAFVVEFFIGSEEKAA